MSIIQHSRLINFLGFLSPIAFSTALTDLTASNISYQGELTNSFGALNTATNLSVDENIEENFFISHLLGNRHFFSKYRSRKCYAGVRG